MSKIKYIKSWVGMENYLEQIRSIAREIVASDSEARKKYPSSVATGLICEAMQNPSKTHSIDIERAAKAQNELFELHAFLVSKGLDYDFVMKEWITILDPSPENIARFNKLAK